MGREIPPQQLTIGLSYKSLQLYSEELQKWRSGLGPSLIRLLSQSWPSLVTRSPYS